MKKAAAEGRAAGTAAAQERARRIHDELARLCVASRELPAQDPRLSGHSGTMVLNGAYLVPDDAGDAFAARIEELAAEHQDVLVDGRGPWPPYSFAMLEQ
jgi:hypothetical protein